MDDARQPDPASCGTSCCAGPGACVFAKALLAQQARCTLAQRQSAGEQERVVCPSPVARTNCETLLALMRERATFALKLPRAGTPLMHARALQVQCGGVLGLQQSLGATERDVHALVTLAHQRHGSLLDLPWADMVPVMAAWQARRPYRTRPL